jgi:membrane protein YqaA with SNARE-associated domain
MMIGVVVEWRRVLDQVGSVGGWGFRVRFVEDWILGLQVDQPSLKFGGNQQTKKKTRKKQQRKIDMERLVWFNMFFVLVLALDWALIFPCPRECVEGCNALYS